MNNIPIENILFLDIETVPQHPSYSDVPNEMKSFWEYKSERIDKDKSAEELYARAGIYAEFGKIICIGVGHVRKQNNSFNIRIKTFHGHDEEQILNDFFSLLKKNFNTENHYLCAHNGKEFDFPYIARRAIVHRIPIPTILNISGCKPWEVRHLDTMELWRFGDYKSYTSLNLLASIFGIPSPKDDISGSDVYKVYYKDNDLTRISDYCKKDVVTLIKVYLRYQYLDNLPQQIEFV